MGGIAIFAGIAAAFIVQYVGTMHFGWPVVLVPSPRMRVNYWMLVLAFCVIFLTGLLDDKFSLKPKQKLAGQLLAAVIAVAGGLVIGDISNPFGVGFISLGWLAYPVTVVYLVAYVNIINLIDGLDGLAAGISAIASFTMFVLSVTGGPPRRRRALDRRHRLGSWFFCASTFTLRPSLWVIPAPSRLALRLVAHLCSPSPVSLDSPRSSSRW